ncbi:hypothetical protein ES705_45996 [subsurface metagenome]
MPDDKVVKVRNELYDKAKDMAGREGISIANAIARLVEQGGANAPTSCQLSNFDAILREQGLTPPRRPDWVWGVTDVLPAEMLAGTKLGHTPGQGLKPSSAVPLARSSTASWLLAS